MWEWAQSTALDTLTHNSKTNFHTHTLKRGKKQAAKARGKETRTESIRKTTTKSIETIQKHYILIEFDAYKSNAQKIKMMAEHCNNSVTNKNEISINNIWWRFFFCLMCRQIRLAHPVFFNRSMRENKSSHTKHISSDVLSLRDYLGRFSMHLHFGVPVSLMLLFTLDTLQGLKYIYTTISAFKL